MALVLVFLLFAFAASQDIPADIPQDIRDIFSTPVSEDSDQPMLFRDAYPFWRPEPPTAKSGEPLVLSPLLENGEVEEARRLSRVQLPNYKEDIESYSGFLTVDKKHNSNLFFWFFPSPKEDPNNEIPLLLWLQGGPGASSLIGLFLEFGPFVVKNVSGAHTLIKNEHSWAKECSLLFIDQPVGTGFSYTDSLSGYVKNISTSSEHLYDALTQFFALYGDYEAKPFYITGESYAGKYVPALAHEIHKRNELGAPKINLQGVAIGNGFTDPTSMLSYSNYMFQLGLIDTKARKFMESIEEYTKRLLEKEQYVLAYNGFSAIWKIFYTVSGYKTPYNYLKEEEDDADPFKSDFAKYVQTPEMRQALHVGNTEFKSIGPVYWNLLGDFMTSGKSNLEEVIKNYRVLLYSGQMDIICAYPLSVNLFNKLQFEEKEKYEKAPRWIWYNGENIAGYIKSTGRFTEALIRNSGHLCPADQPVWSLDLITRFTRDQLKPESSSNESIGRKQDGQKKPEEEKGAENKPEVDVKIDVKPEVEKIPEVVVKIDEKPKVERKPEVGKEKEREMTRKTLRRFS